MLVDDHRDSAEMYSFALRGMRMDSFTALSSDDAYALACERRPDVIVSDLRLGTASGFDLARRLRAARETSDAGIIVLTGQSGASTEQEAHAAGCDRFLLKPCLPAELASVIRDVLAVRQRTGSETFARLEHPKG
jgi:DNA-binding response OmpR family regulator